eukprot:PITA_24741
MGSPLKLKAIRDLLKQEQPDLLLIQETKISAEDFQHQSQNFKNFIGVSIGSEGASGRIGTMWNKNKWEIINSQFCSWWVRTDLKNKGSQEIYYIYNIYAPNHHRDKGRCWETISSDLQSVQNRKIILGGDLNLIRNVEEKLGGNYHADPSRDMLESIIQLHNLMDIPLSNGKYTWSNKRIGLSNIKERLDRFLLQEGIAASFQSIKSHLIHASASDHKPVILNLDKGRNLGPLPFKYNKIWDLQDDFRSLIKNQWAKEVNESPYYVWETKLKALRSVIKQWAKEAAVMENKKKSDLLLKMEQWNKAKENIQYTIEDLDYEKEMRAGNQIDKIEVDGKQLSDQEEIKEAAHNHFKSLLSIAPQQTDSFEFLNAIESKISEAQNKDLDQDITKEEICAATFSMQQDKAPGPDGFTVAFYRNHWETIKKDFVRMVKNVFQNHKMGENTKSSHIALIPKEMNPLSFDIFRPISLCNVSYKIVTKILANRLKKLLPHLISENQGGFVPNRQITDNVILIQEAIRSSYNRGEREMIIKLDMANAFDRVDHSFLTETLKRFGLSKNFISIINGCISNPWTAPLINGRPSNYFKSSRGLRQGCPLSPFLFIIIAETLSIHLENLRRKKEITGIRIERGTKEINHSLFTNDTLLIGGASSLMAKRFKKVLYAFLAASGGKLNNRKCKIYTWNVPLQIQQRISLILDIPVQRNWSFFSYLGLPLAKETVKVEIWAKHIERMRGLLQSWGVSWLNLASRVILIKAILSALPIYQYAVILASASIHKHMEIILRSFLWQGGKQETKKFSLVKWDQVTLPYEKGGLSIKIPSLSNRALGFKLIWRILIGKGSWWVEVIKRKYLSGPNSNLLSEPIVERPCTPVWKLIKKVLPQFRENTSKFPGNGKSINIWSDRIMGSKPRNLHQASRPLQIWMEERNLTTLYDISTWNQNIWQDWKDLNLPIDLRDLWSNLKRSLSGFAPTNSGVEDRYIWDSSGGKFTVKEGYKILQATTQIANWNLHTTAWKSECLPKIKHFNWTLLKGKILTAENLRKRGIQGPSRCCFCCAEEESTQHIFLLCPFAQSCWKQVINPMTISESFDQSTSLQKNWGKCYPFPKKGKHNINRLWKCIPATLCWQIWLARNNYVFNNKKPSIASTLAKTIAIISESISTNLIALPDQSSWQHAETQWYNKFNLSYTNLQHPQTKPHKKRSHWKLRGTKEEVNQWISDQKRPTLHFDGASKNNPGKAAAGGIIKNHRGETIVSYEWGLGRVSNNVAEAYSLLLGTSILNRLEIKNPIIMGDSAIIIAALVSGADFNKASLSNIKLRIQHNIINLGEITFKHVLRENNAAADSFASKAVSRPSGQIRENEHLYDKAIP